MHNRDDMVDALRYALLSLPRPKLRWYVRLWRWFYHKYRVFIRFIKKGNPSA